MHRAHRYARSLELGMGRIDGGTIPKMKRKMRPCSTVVGSQEGQALPPRSGFQVTPILGVPHQFHAKGAVEALGPLHILDTDGHVTQPFNSSHGCSEGDFHSGSFPGRLSP